MRKSSSSGTDSTAFYFETPNADDTAYTKNSLPTTTMLFMNEDWNLRLPKDKRSKYTDKVLRKMGR